MKIYVKNLTKISKKVIIVTIIDLENPVELAF